MWCLKCECLRINSPKLSCRLSQNSAYWAWSIFRVWRSERWKRRDVLINKTPLNMRHGHWRRWSQWPLTSSRSCLMGSPSWRSASDRKSPVWSIQVRKSWASRCRRWPAPVPPAAGQYSITTHYKSSWYKGQRRIRSCINTCVWQQVIILQRSEKFGFIISEL